MYFTYVHYHHNIRYDNYRQNEYQYQRKAYDSNLSIPKSCHHDGPSYSYKQDMHQLQSSEENMENSYHKPSHETERYYHKYTDTVTNKSYADLSVISTRRFKKPLITEISSSNNQQQLTELTSACINNTVLPSETLHSRHTTRNQYGGKNKQNKQQTDSHQHQNGNQIQQPLHVNTQYINNQQQCENNTSSLVTIPNPHPSKFLPKDHFLDLSKPLRHPPDRISQ